jgi:hypothetical protein
MHSWPVQCLFVFRRILKQLLKEDAQHAAGLLYYPVAATQAEILEKKGDLTP